MKIKTLFLLVVIITICITPFSCKKEVHITEDFRLKYIGDWDFVVKTIEKKFGDYHETIDYYSGTITLGNKSGNIIIEYLENTSIAMSFMSSDDIYCSGCPFYAMIRGFFSSKDTVYISGSNSNASGTQSWSLYISGYRKNTQ